MGKEGSEQVAQMPSAHVLADERTVLAHERTLMAWVRTAMSLITFGFTVYKFFQLYDDKRSDRPIGAREYALLMIGTGVISLIIATYQHYNYRRNVQLYHPGLPRSVAGFSAVMISLLGIIAIVVIVLRY